MINEQIPSSDYESGSVEHCQAFAVSTFDLACRWLESVIENSGNFSTQGRLESCSGKVYEEAMQEFILAGTGLPVEQAQQLLAYFKCKRAEARQHKFDAATPVPPPPGN